MKAILVVDMPNDLENYYCNIQIVNKHLPPFHPDNLAANYIGYVEPKPMPSKIQENYILFGDEVVWQKAVGYNQCLDDILGETDD